MRFSRIAQEIRDSKLLQRRDLFAGTIPLPCRNSLANHASPRTPGRRDLAVHVAKLDIALYLVHHWPS